MKPLAKRLDTLEGKTIAQLWDDLFRGDEILPMLEEALGKRFPGVNFVDHDTFGSTHGDEEHECSASCRASQGAEGRRGHLRHGVLRELHARRVAGQRGSRRGRRAPSLAVCEGFLGQAKTTSVGLGLPNLPLAIVPGHVDVQTTDELRANVLGVDRRDVVRNLTGETPRRRPTVEPDPREIVFEGSFEEVNRLFYENGWSDGLPIVPPTRSKIEEFLRLTDRAPDDALGMLLPDNRAPPCGASRSTA